MSKVHIEPKILKGFQDYLPRIAIVRERMMQTLREVFVSFGFSPIDTPALEYSEILLGKGSNETDKQLYRFMDQGERDVALRFDLTVPLARFMAMHINDLGKPFKRYHIAPVWRAEKPQRGRYREFVQCDFDILGTDSMVADAEVLAIVHASLDALKIRHRIRLNNRAILNGLLEQLDALDKSTAVLRAIDKLEKLGREVVVAELENEAGFSSALIDKILTFVALTKDSTSNADVIGKLKEFFSNNEKALSGIKGVETVFSVLYGYGMDDRHIQLDLSIARGLDYYTGTVFETELLDLPNIGSISSGGRYDNLASLYTNQRIPGVGGSIGLDRILGAYEELNLIGNRASTADVLVTVMSYEDLAYAARIAQNLRSCGECVELYPEPTKLGNQLKYASKKGIMFAIIAGETERTKNQCSVKVLSTGEQVNDVSVEDVFACLKTLRGN